MRLASGPYWLSANSDPAYLYLLNSLYYLRGISSYFTDHPGTTLHMLFVGLFFLLNLGHSAQDIIIAVLLHPEFYLNAMSILLTILFLCSVILVGWYAYKKSGSMVFAMLLQCPVFFYLTLKAHDAKLVLPIVANINAEPLMITLFNFFAIVFLKIYYAPGKFLPNDIIWLAVIFAAGLATKFTFAPLVLLAFFVLKGARAQSLFVFSAAGWFLIFLAPIWNRIEQIETWLYSVFFVFNSSGPAGWEWLYHEQPVFFTLAIGVALVAILQFKRMSRLVAYQTAVVSLGVIVLNWVFVARNPQPQYLVIGRGALAMAVAFFYLACQETAKDKHEARYVEKFGKVLVILFIVLGSFAAGAYAKKLSVWTHERVSFYQQVQNKYAGCKIIGYYRSSGPEFALQFGDGTKDARILGEDLQKIYPGWYFFQPLDYRLTSWTRGKLMKSAQDESACIYFKGTCGYPFDAGPYQTQMVDQGPGECVYHLVGSTENPAINSVIQAKILIKRKSYKRAYLALKRSIDHKIFPAHMKPVIEEVCPHLAQGEDIFNLCK